MDPSQIHKLKFRPCSQRRIRKKLKINHFNKKETYKKKSILFFLRDRYITNLLFFTGAAFHILSYSLVQETKKRSALISIFCYEKSFRSLHIKFFLFVKFTLWSSIFVYFGIINSTLPKNCKSVPSLRHWSSLKNSLKFSMSKV